MQDILTGCEVSPDIERSLSKAKFDLVRLLPFIGFLVMTCDYRFSRSTFLKTALAHVGERGAPVIFINVDFWEALAPPIKAWVLLHEVLHIFLQHAGRQKDQGYDPGLWNEACDYVINFYIQEIIEANSSNLVTIEPWPHQLIDERFAGMTADEVYEILLEERGTGMGGRSEGDSDGDQQGTERSLGEPGNAFDAVATERLSSDRQQEIKQLISAAISQCDTSDMIGVGADSLIRVFKSILEPSIPWREALSAFIEKSVTDQYTYRRPSRRSSGNIIFPSRSGEPPLFMVWRRHVSIHGAGRSK